MFAAFITTVLYSLSSLFAQRTARILGGISANFWRMLLATFMLAAMARVWGQEAPAAARPWLFVSGLIGFGIGDVALFQALPRIGSRLSMLLVHCLATPTAALVEYLWLDTRLTAVQVVCVGISLSGVAFALAPSQRPHADRHQFSLGLFWGLVAMLGQSMGAVLSRKALTAVKLAGGGTLDGITQASTRAWGGILVATIVYLGFVARERWMATARNPAPAAASAVPRGKAWGWVLCNTLAGPVLGVSCFQWALSQAPTGVVLPIVALTPLVILPLAHWMEGEKTTRREILGGSIAVTGVAILARLRATG
ncbi:MAG: DMT family transporter [Verrucomicrobia bacterium]|nr:DMT family transporter [Verrucomicrobiota bacterium]MBI3869664.1 DMT family transporter [Verrucomicrobiota bacterium]